MRFRFLDRLVPSSRAQRRIQRVGSVVLLWVGYPFRLLIGLAKTIGQLVATWWDSRNLRFLLQGLPALFMTIGVLVAGAVIFFQDRAALAIEYETQGARSLAEARQRHRAGQETKAPIAMAQMCYKRLSPTGKPENMFHMAETYELQRQGPAAAQIYDSLAPLDPTKPGYGPAHFMVARRLLGSNPNPKQILEAENHLIQADQYSQVKNDRQEAFYGALARAALFDVLRDTNRPDEAEMYLVKAVEYLGDEEPQFRLKLSDWYWRTGKRDQAEDQVNRAIVTLIKRSDENLNDRESRLNLIECLKFSGGLKCARGDFKKGKEDFARAMAACQRGMAMTTDPALRQTYLSVMCYLFLAQFDGTLHDPNTTYADRFGLLETAMGLRPNDVNLIERLKVFVTKSGPERDKARDQLQKMIDEGKHLCLAHMILGTAAWDEGDFATAKFHWEKAFEQTDWSPLVANNLAWLLAFMSKPPDLERALMLVNAALSKQDYPQFHGTKGHILAAMGRNQEALPELLAAKPAYVHNPKEGYQLFKRLAEVSGKLGMESEAKRYEKMAADAAKAIKDAKAAGGPPAAAGAPNTKPVAAGATAPGAPKP